MSQDAFEWLQELGFADHEHELTDLGVVSVEDMEGLTKEVLLQTSLKSKQIDSLLAGVRGMEVRVGVELCEGGLDTIGPAPAPSRFFPVPN